MAFIDSNIIIDGLAVLIICAMLPARLKSPRLLRLLMICCAAVCLTDIPGILLDGQVFPGARALLWAFDTAYWLLHICYCWLWVLFTQDWCYPQRKGLKRRARRWAPLMALAMLAVCANPWTGWLFTLDEGNVYAPGSAYQLCLIPHYLYIAASLAMAISACLAVGDPEGRRRGLALLAYMLLPLCGVIMEGFAYGVSWVWPMVALSLLMLTLNLQQQAIADERLAAARAAESAARMEAEMANSRMRVMLSQIQPHFLYNALCVIQDLCHGKATEAEQATIAFSRYLRGNLDSLQENKPIPFARELAHTRQYLTLEQLRFGPRLRVSYDLTVEDFLLPAMTLQPLVENAVRHGILKKEAGGSVRIATQETPQGYRLTVEDDGVGFDPGETLRDGRSHTGIQSVRQRLWEMCGGELTIRSAKGQGATAAIQLPKGEHKG